MEVRAGVALMFGLRCALRWMLDRLNPLRLLWSSKLHSARHAAQEDDMKSLSPRFDTIPNRLRIPVNEDKNQSRAARGGRLGVILRLQSFHDQVNERA